MFAFTAKLPTPNRNFLHSPENTSFPNKTEGLFPLFMAHTSDTPWNQRLGMIHGDMFVTLIVLPRTGGRKIFFAVSAFWLHSIKRKKWLVLVLSILSWCQNKNLCSKIQKCRILNIVFGFCLKKNQIPQKYPTKYSMALWKFTNWIRLKTFTWKPLKHLEGIAASVTGRLDQKESTSKSIRHQKWFFKKSWGKKTSYVCQSSKKKTRLET